MKTKLLSVTLSALMAAPAFADALPEGPMAFEAIDGSIVGLSDEWKIPAGYSQRVISDESDLDIYPGMNDWDDMNTVNEGPDHKHTGRYLYRTHEVRPDSANLAAFTGGAVSVVDLKTGKELWHFAYNTKFSGLAFSPDGSRMLCAFVDRTLKVWDTRTFRLVHDFRYPGPKAEHMSELGFTVTPDGNRIVVYMWMARGFEVWDLVHKHRVWAGKAGDEISRIHLSADGRRLFCRTYETLDVWDMESGKLLWRRDHKVLVRG